VKPRWGRTITLMDEIKIVGTSINSDEKFCKCQFCDKIIAEITKDDMIPSFQDCYNNGNVPVPNFGWFCSQACATEYEKKTGIKFSHTEEGKVDYYADGF
jgi:hypothetical protein